MGKICISLIINLIVTVSILGGGDPEIGDILFIIFMSGWVLSLIGALVYQSNMARWAFICGCIGFIIFIPIGAIGIFGMQSIQAERNNRDVLARLAAKNPNSVAK